MQVSARARWRSSSEPQLQCCSSMGPHHRKEAAARSCGWLRVGFPEL